MFSIGTLLPILGLVFLSTDSSALPSSRYQQLSTTQHPAPSPETDHNTAHEDSIPMSIDCNGKGRRCWSKGKLLHSNDRCYPPLSRGPCADGQWWVLDRNGTRASIRGKCVELRCPPDRRSAECRRRMREFAQACPRLPSGHAQFAVHTNPMGEFRCGAAPGRVQALHHFIQCYSPSTTTESYQLPLRATNDSEGEPHREDVINTNGVICAQTNNGRCSDLVLGSLPGLTLSSED